MPSPADESAPSPAADPHKPTAFPANLAPRRDETISAAPALERQLALKDATYLPTALVAPPATILSPLPSGALTPASPVPASAAPAPTTSDPPLAADVAPAQSLQSTAAALPDTHDNITHDDITDIDRCLLELDAPFQGLSPRLAAACRSVKPGSGEDARPIAWTHPNGDGWFLAVCDGMGGSGPLRHTIGNRTYTGAAIGATSVARYVGGWLTKQTEEAWRCVCSGDHITLASRIREHLAQIHRCFGATTSKVKFKLFRPFPTTFAAVAIHRVGGHWVADCYWAGDSRIYQYGVRHGLRQLTRDDLDGDQDPYENLEQDGALSNLCSGDQQPKRLNHRRYTDISEDDILFAASDGVFHYQQSPMHFEMHLALHILKEPWRGWQAMVDNLLQALPNQDDRSIALVDLNAAEMDRLQWRTGPCADRIKSMERIAEMKRGPDLEALWKQYRTTYCAYELTEPT